MNDKQREKILKALTQQARRASKKGAFAEKQKVSKLEDECIYRDGYVSLSLPSDLVESHTVLDIRTKRDIDRGVERVKLDDTTPCPFDPYNTNLDNYKSYEYSVEELLYRFKDLKSDTWVEDDGIITISGNDDEYFNSSGFRFRTLDFETDGCTAVDVNYLLTVLKVMDILRDKKVTLYLNTRNHLNPIMLHSESVKGEVVPKLLGFSW